MTATTQVRTDFEDVGVSRTIQAGIVSGLVGGSVFGGLMAAGGMLPMVAGLAGSTSVVIGFVLHMLISAFIGATYSLIAVRLPWQLTVQTAAGAVYGIVWWVLGALIMMPLLLGMGEMVFQVGDMQLMSLVGHTIFGFVMGVSFLLLRRYA